MRRRTVVLFLETITPFRSVYEHECRWTVALYSKYSTYQFTQRLYVGYTVLTDET